jgi:thiol-disulfide isomerase/thioredoxin
MKKLLILFTIIALVSCKKEAPKDYVTLQGKIDNANNETLTILGQNFKKDISVAEDGTFNDTLKVTDGFHGFNDGEQQSFIYLKNGYDITLNFDTKDFPGSISFDGEGSGTNEYLNTKLEFIKTNQLDKPKLMFELDKPEFDNRLADLTKELDALLTDATDLDPEVLKMEQEANLKLVNFYTESYEREHTNAAAFKKGAESPKFSYPDTTGKIVSLDDLKGKYVYVDVWATWCGPCKREIPHLKELDAAYENKDINFVSLSIDKQEDKEKWLKMVQDENLQGIQILADNDWNSDFVKAYNITGIPRFILIDKEGNILDADAPRPSDPRLKEVLNSLNL